MAVDYSKRVIIELEKAAELFLFLSEVYQDNHHRLGSVMEALFPEGVKAVSKLDHERLAFVYLLAVKFTRYCVQFKEGGHPDSTDDMALYATMLSALDKDSLEIPF